MSELQDALDEWDRFEHTNRGTKLILDAAKLVANPNIEAAEELAWINWRTHPSAVHAIIAAALTPPGDTE